MSVVPNSDEPKVEVDPTSPAEPPEPVPGPLEDQTVATDSLWVQASVYAIGAALVAGLLAWGIGETTYAYYQPSAHSSREFTAMNREKRIADQKNTAIVFGSFGGILGLLSGAAGGALRRSIASGVNAALVGLLLGGIGATLVSYELAPIFGRYYSDETPSLLLSFLTRGGIWAVAGMMAGLALGWGWQGPLAIPRTLIGGLSGSVLGTIAFEIVNAVLFPGDRNDAVIPSSTRARLLACLLVSVGAAIGAVLFGTQRSRPASHISQAQS